MASVRTASAWCPPAELQPAVWHNRTLTPSWRKFLRPSMFRTTRPWRWYPTLESHILPTCFVFTKSKSKCKRTWKIQNWLKTKHYLFEFYDAAVEEKNKNKKRTCRRSPRWNSWWIKTPIPHSDRWTICRQRISGAWEISFRPLRFSISVEIARRPERPRCPFVGAPPDPGWTCYSLM